MSRVKNKPRSGSRLVVNKPAPNMKPQVRRGILFALAATIIVGAAWLAWNSGWPQRQANNAGKTLLAGTASLGFSLEDVTIVGREQIDRDELLYTLQVERGMPLFALDRQEMAARLRTIPWLAGATVQRHWPSTLLINLTERTPLARWQTQGQMKLLDEHGAVIQTVAAQDFTDLPLVVGAGADKRAADLLTALQTYPAILPLLRAAICVGERRWDLQLEPGVTVRLPEGHPTLALKRLSYLLRDQQILNREVQAVDLRFPDRLILERPNAPAAPNKNNRKI